MVDERVLLIFNAYQEDIDALIICLKSLRIFPPAVDYDVCVTVPEKDQEVIDLLDDVDHVRTCPYSDTLGQVLNSILDSTQHRYIVIAHSDVVFKAPNWNDQVFSTMLQNDLAMLGSLPFHRYEIKNGGNIQTSADWFKAYLREPLMKVGGFHGLTDLHGNNFISHLRLRKHGFQVMVGDINPFVAHLNCCKIDKTEIPSHTISDLSFVFDRENLGEIQ